MKKLRLLSGIFLMMLMAINISCSEDAEPVDPAVLDPNITDCAMPSNFVVSDTINTTTVNVSWLGNGTESGWEIEWGPAGFTQGEGTVVPTTTTMQTITGIDATLNYHFYVRSICNDEMASSWVGPLPVNSAAAGCANPIGISATPSEGSDYAINVNWTAVGTPGYWRIQYGVAGFTLGTGSIVSSQSTFRHIGGLDAGTSYDIYIMASCLSDTNANWAGPFTVTTNNGTPPNYWPMAVNNEWVYKQNGVDQPAMKIISSEAISGISYFNFNNLFGTSTNGAGFTGKIQTRKSGSDYYVRQSAEIAGPPAIVLEPFEILIFKDNLAVNETWQQTVTQTTIIAGMANDSEVTVSGKILEKGITMVINGVTYNDVIKSELIQESMGQTNTNYYWFANHIGPIKVQNILNDTTIDQELVTYIVN